MEIKKELLKKILAVMSEMGKLPKSGYNSFHKYNYVTEADAMDRLRYCCIRNGLVIIPNCKSSRIEGELTSVEIEYMICDVDTGFSVTADIPGQGIDKGDKGIYKAITGSFKYFIMKTFMVPSGDDPEADEKHVPATAKKVFPTATTVQPYVNQHITPPTSSFPPVAEFHGEVDTIAPLKEDGLFSVKELIENRLFELAGNDVELMKRIMLACTTFKTKDGKVMPGVDDPRLLKFVAREGKDQSQADVTLKKLNKMTKQGAEAL